MSVTERAPVGLAGEWFPYVKPASPTLCYELLVEYTVSRQTGSWVRAAAALLAAASTVGPWLKLPYRGERPLEYGLRVSDALHAKGVEPHAVIEAAQVVFAYLSEDRWPTTGEVEAAAGNSGAAGPT